MFFIFSSCVCYTTQYSSIQVSAKYFIGQRMAITAGLGPALTWGLWDIRWPSKASLFFQILSKIKFKFSLSIILSLHLSVHKPIYLWGSTLWNGIFSGTAVKKILIKSIYPLAHSSLMSQTRYACCKCMLKKCSPIHLSESVAFCVVLFQMSVFLSWQSIPLLQQNQSSLCMDQHQWIYRLIDCLTE